MAETRVRNGVPVRLRIAGWYTAVLFIALVVAGVFIYVEVQDSLTDALEDDLEERSALLLNVVTFDAAGNPSLELPTSDRRFASSFQRLLDRNGAPITDNQAVYGPVPIEADELQDAREDRNGREWSNLDLLDAPNTRLLTTSIRDGDRLAGYLQVGDSRHEIDETLDAVILSLGLIAPVTAAGCGLIGWWLAGRALQPINEITTRAGEIADGDLKRRLNLRLPDDEVGRLARTFDTMIGRLDEMWTRQRRFTADASHELRTPLTALRGQVEVALSQPRENEAYRKTLEGLGKQIERMTRLVEGLLLVARSEAGAIPLEREKVDIGELMHSIEDQVAPAATAKGLELRVADGPPAVLHGDEGLLLQLMLNLTENAIHYTKQGSVVLSWQQAGSRTLLRVQDTGTGIPEEHLGRIFEPFYRVDVSRSNGSGAGLGLAICKWIAEAHDGRIEVASTAGGTTFTVILPNNGVKEADS